MFISAYVHFPITFKVFSYVSSTSTVSAQALYYLVIVSSVSEEATKGDGVGDAAQVDEEHSRDRLNVEPLVEITWQPWQFPL